MNDVLTDAVSFKQETTSKFNMNMTALSDSVQRAAMNFSDARTAMDGAKQVIETAIHDTASKNVALRASIGSLSNDSLLVNDDIQSLKEQVQELRERVKKAQEIDALREEQTKTLAERNEANLHSSWMGLLRPLREESQMGLLIAGICFLIVGAVGIYFLYRMGFFTRTPDIFSSGGYRRIIRQMHI